MSRRIFISDIHMSAGLGLNPPSGQFPWEWFSEADLARMTWFLEHLLQSHQTDPIDEVVLLGDVFDNWVFPHDMKPPTLAEILASPRLKPVYERLNRLSEACGMLFLPGNHDYSLTHLQLMSVLPRVGFGGRGVDCPQFASGQLLAEHGNGKALFCSPDPQRQDALPLGYFISRLAATASRRTGSHDPNARVVAQVLIHGFAKETIAQEVVDAVARMAGVDDSTQILMPEDFWGGKTTTVGAVKATYAKLFSEFERRHGLIGTAIAVPAETGNLAPLADSYLLRSGTRLVVMGHTHGATVQQFDYLKKAAYVNSGCWCGGTRKAGWVEVRKDDRGHYTISVKGCSQAQQPGAFAISDLFSPFEL